MPHANLVSVVFMNYFAGVSLFAPILSISVHDGLWLGVRPIQVLYLSCSISFWCGHLWFPLYYLQLSVDIFVVSVSLSVLDSSALGVV